MKTRASLKYFMTDCGTIRLKNEVNFIIREFLEVFYFPSDFIVVLGNLEMDFWEASVLSKSF